MVFPTSFTDNGFFDLCHPPTTFFLTSVAHRQWSLRPPSLANHGPFDLRRQITIFLTSVAHRKWSFQPPLSDNGLSDLRRPQTNVFPTSVACLLQSFRPPSLTTVKLGLEPKKQNAHTLKGSFGSEVRMTLNETLPPVVDVAMPTGKRNGYKRREEPV
ncbi:hypothetical protein M5K25_022800 [Dendrobium thyrsiflorum]|uniref:Uncharacterized protein n=1 Tax=Dendrobium thyrsiflorum TaxID=117978 RepID=A0ABD0U6Y3_DENTH